MLSTFLVALLFIGILFIISDVIRSKYKSEQPKIIYRYIPRNLDEYMSDPPLVTDMFKKMFNGPDPWINGVDVIDDKQQLKIQKDFVSGVRQ